MQNQHKTSFSGRAVAFLSGAALASGLILSGMTDGRKVSSFFNWHRHLVDWDPTMLVVFASALITNALIHHIVINRILKQPLLAPKFSIPTNTEITLPLVCGAAFFGVGWSFSAYCPGPAFVSLPNGDIRTLAFVLCMWASMAFYKWQDSRNSPTYHDLPASVISTLSVFAMAVAVLWYALKYPDVAVAQDPVPLAFSWERSVGGGVLIGLSVGMMMVLLGEVLGISGLLAGIFSPQTLDKSFRLSFAVGMLVVGVLTQFVFPQLITQYLHRSIWFFIVGGILVGYGTSLANGCTSGHGIAGFSRLSRRSVVGVLVFFSANIVTTTSLAAFADVGSGWQKVLVG